MTNKRILILSSYTYADISKQPRVLKEVAALRNNYSIFTEGAYGDRSGKAGYTFINTDYFQREKFHYKLPTPLRKLFSLFIRITNPVTKRIKENFNREDSWKYKFKILKNFDFNLVIVHCLPDLPLAFEMAKMKNAKIIMNAHEYYPNELDDNKDWVKNIQPHHIKICADYLPEMDAIFSVGEIIANEYKKEFGVKSIVITNAKKYENLTPVPVGSKIRIIHHGAAIRSRGIEEMITMMGILGDSYTLDLMLTPADEKYLNELRSMASHYTNITFRPLVATADIAKETNEYDIGCFLLPPSNFNYLNALPNKFFEFIQARLAIAIGPSPEMALLVKKYDLGVVAKEFTAQSMAEEIRKLSPEKIMYYKNRCHENAHELSAETDEQKILNTVNNLLKE